MNSNLNAPTVTRQNTIGEVVAKYPALVDTLEDFGLHCVGCSVSPFETLESGAKGHGMKDAQIDAMIDAVNKFIAKHKDTAKTGKLVEITENAASHLKRLMEKEGKPNSGLRLQLVPGGCAGFSYQMEFEESPTANDEVIETQGIKIFFEKDSATHIQGTVIDYRDSLRGAGFVMNNPNAKSSCGCGHSSGF
ncbi:MAG TPA: iron-sulfur cluster assembly accessory protein [Candidatus Norongarragalinales archaeon]|jgi:iron-sulfur cluster assembly accessory protein|nr:iron-sulfur cluster assembly accessory protein [Candidatus Norongarragalinales archaeon]